MTSWVGLGPAVRSFFCPFFTPSMNFFSPATFFFGSVKVVSSSSFAFLFLLWLGCVPTFFSMSFFPGWIMTIPGQDGIVRPFPSAGKVG